MPKEKKKVFRTAIYCRLSKEDGDKVVSNSIEGQISFCKDFVNRTDELKIAYEPFIDDGVSGVLLDRPAFNEMDKLVREGKIDCIVCRDLDIHEENKQVIYEKKTEISQSAEEMTKEQQCDLLLSASNMDISVLSEEEQKIFRECFVKVSEHSVKKFNLSPQKPRQGRNAVGYCGGRKKKGR